MRLEAVAGQVVELLVGRSVGVHPDDSTPVGVKTGATGDSGTMSETPPTSAIRREPSEDETIVADDWPVRPEGQVVVEQTETETTPPRKAPLIWPWLLALLVLVLGGLGAYSSSRRTTTSRLRRPPRLR